MAPVYIVTNAVDVRMKGYKDRTSRIISVYSNYADAKAQATKECMESLVAWSRYFPEITCTKEDARLIHTFEKPDIGDCEIVSYLDNDGKTLSILANVIKKYVC